MHSSLSITCVMGTCERKENVRSVMQKKTLRIVNLPAKAHQTASASTSSKRGTLKIRRAQLGDSLIIWFVFSALCVRRETGGEAIFDRERDSYRKLHF